jgi:hypothetical protein
MNRHQPGSRKDVYGNRFLPPLLVAEVQFHFFLFALLSDRASTTDWLKNMDESCTGLATRTGYVVHSLELTLQVVHHISLSSSFCKSTCCEQNTSSLNPTTQWTGRVIWTVLLLSRDVPFVSGGEASHSQQGARMHATNMERTRACYKGDSKQQS